MRTYKLLILILFLATASACSVLNLSDDKDLIGQWTGYLATGEKIQFNIERGNLARRSIFKETVNITNYQNWEVVGDVVILSGSGCFDFGNGLENVIVFYNDELIILSSPDNELSLYDKERKVTFAKKT